MDSTIGKPRGAARAARVESGQRFFVLPREEAAGRFRHRRVVARVDLKVGAANESRALVIAAKRVVARKTVEPKQLATRGNRRLLSELDQLDAQAARVATHRDAMDVARRFS